MKRVQSGQGVTDLGSQMSAGERESRVDKPVLRGTPDRTVTFTGFAAQEYQRVKGHGWAENEAFAHADAIQQAQDAAKLNPAYAEAIERHEAEVGNPWPNSTTTERLADPDPDPDNVVKTFQKFQDQQADLSEIIADKRREIIAADPNLERYFNDHGGASLNSIEPDDPVLQPPNRTYEHAVDCITDQLTELPEDMDDFERARFIERALFDSNFVIVRRA